MDIQTAILLLGAGAFTYYVIYKKNHLAGNILFILIGIITMLAGIPETEANFKLAQMGAGLLIIIGGLINEINDAMQKISKDR